ncbi:MAG: hypothetical protein Fur0041_17070 [Bacteroidia bacterium]
MKNHFRKAGALIALAGVSFNLSAQVDQHERLISDTCSFRDALCKGHFEGHARSVFMFTDNSGNLTDSWALAAGAGIGYETRIYKHIQFGVSGFFLHNMASSDMTKTDAATGQLNRYELGLFDMDDPNNKHDLDRLEQLFTKIHFKNFKATIGKQLLNTPFLNAQDGRMIPTKFDGAWVNGKIGEHCNYEGGWLWSVSPRSTVRWNPVAYSVGIYPSGVNTEGGKSNYHQNLKSAGIGAGSFSYKNKGVSVSVWDVYAENIFNTGMIEVKYKSSNDENKLISESGIMYIRQDAVNYGGNEDPSKAYMDKGAYSNSLSAFQALTFNKKIKILTAYTHITGDGRYLMPREWGRDPFYTFMPRERNEGMGNVHAAMLKAERFNKAEGWSFAATAGYYKLPDVKDYRLNKYGFPSYIMVNLEGKYRLKKQLDGMEILGLITWKGNAGETYNSLKYIYNKVDLMHYTLAVNYYF